MQPSPEEAALSDGRLEGWMHGKDPRPSFETRERARAPHEGGDYFAGDDSGTAIG
jgi:hypothetical protein